MASSADRAAPKSCDTEVRLQWGGYLCDKIQNRKKLGGLLGKHIEKFTKDCKQILDFINNKIFDDKDDDFLQGVKGCLKLWPKIYSFVREANVGSDYLLDIQNYKDNCVEYYTYAGKLFMKKGKESTKTFYMHAMRCYVP